MEVQLCTPAYSTSQITWFFKLYAYIYIYIHNTQHRTFHMGIIPWSLGCNKNGRQTILQLCKAQAWIK